MPKNKKAKGQFFTRRKSNAHIQIPPQIQPTPQLGVTVISDTTRVSMQQNQCLGNIETILKQQLENITRFAKTFKKHNIKMNNVSKSKNTKNTKNTTYKMQPTKVGGFRPTLNAGNPIMLDFNEHKKLDKHFKGITYTLQESINHAAKINKLLRTIKTPCRI